LTDAALADRIRQDQIDILIDLSGHTGFNRLPVFAWKAAPIQATWLGYFSTTGVAAIDYLIADPVTLRQTEEKYFTETIWRLKQTRLCFTPPSDASPAPGPLPALANGHVTFGCFNHLSKMNDAVVAVWSRLLHAVPGSRLFLKSPPLADAQVRQQTIARFSQRGIDASRLLFEGLSAKQAYLAAYCQVDVALDPFPYPGGTTTMEALWMGVPVLTLEGERFLSRQGVGLLKTAALDAWIATDENDYVERGAALAADLPALAALRARLREQVRASPLCDAPRFAADLTAALREMWRRWCRDRT
jgi:protein O-GlcNAc transferase